MDKKSVIWFLIFGVSFLLSHLTKAQDTYQPDLYPFIHDPIVEVGENFCIELNVAEKYFPNLTAYFNGKPAKVDEDVTLGCATEGCVCFKVPEGAGEFHYPPFYLTLQSGSTVYKGPPVPLKIISGNEIAWKFSPSKLPEIQDGQTAFGVLSSGMSQDYRLSLSRRSLVNLKAMAYDALHNRIIYSGGKPDLKLEIIDQYGNVVAENDNSDSSLNSSFKNLLLKAGSYAISVRRKDEGDRMEGFYALRLDLEKAPYIISLAPAVGLPGDIITIEGCNFTYNREKLKIEFAKDNFSFPAKITTAFASSLRIEVPDIKAKKGEGYLVKITNLETALSTEEPSVEENNQNAIFYFLDRLGDIPESAVGATKLAEEKVGYGVVGEGRGDYIFDYHFAPGYLEIKASLFTYSGQPARNIQPKIKLLNPFGREVPSYQEIEEDSLRAIFILTEDGWHKISVQTIPQTSKPVLYKVSYSLAMDYKPEYKVDSVAIVSGNWQIVQAPIDRYYLNEKIATLSPLEIKVSYKGNPVPNVPVIFRPPRISCPRGERNTSPYRKESILVFTDKDGIARVSSYPIFQAPVIGRIYAYPFNYLKLKVTFHYISLPKISDGYFRIGNTCSSSPGEDFFEVQDLNMTFIPFNFYPEMGEELKVYVMVWDRDGNPVPGVKVKIDLHNFNSDNYQGKIIQDFTKTDSHGLAYCIVQTSYVTDKKLYPVAGGIYPSRGFNHFISASLKDKIKASLYFLVIPQ